MIEQTTLNNILTWIIAVILFIFQSLNYFISRIKKYVKHGQKNTTVVTTDTIILSESNPNNNNAQENVITVQGRIQKHFDIPLIIAEDEPKVNDVIKNARLLTSYDDYKEKKKIDQFMEHLVDDSYVARGLGLITANVGREAEFYLYSKYDNNFENVVIKLKGRQGEIGQITIPNQNPTNSIETKSIPMDYFYDEDRIKVTYTPFAEGVYTLTLVRNGLSICRSPYYISVEKSPTNSRSQIRLGTKKYKMVTKFAKAKHVPLETCDNSIPVIEPSKPSISRNILPTPEENSIRTDVMSIVTKFESNSIHFQKNDQKRTVNISKKSPKTDLFDEISISANSNTPPKTETSNDYDTNISDLSSLSIDSNSKSNDKKFSSNLDISNSKSNDVNSIEFESNLVKNSNKDLDESIRNINDIPRIKNISSNHLEPTKSVLLKESLNDKSSDDVEKHNQTYKTNEPIHGQNQIDTYLDPIINVDKPEIKCIDNEACTYNEVSCFYDDDRKTVIVMKNINELESHPKISMNRQITDSTQYNINTPFKSVLTKITNDVCEKCSIKVLRILSEFPKDINITHNNNSNKICSSIETLLAQPISININIDNLFEKPISLTNEHKTDNLLNNSPTNMKLMDTIDKDIKYDYINEIKPIDNTFNEIYCDINNTTTESMVKQNKNDGEINKTINDKITNNFTIPLTKNNIDKYKTDHLENILSTDNKMLIQDQNVQKSSEHNMDIDKTNQFQFHEYINNELNDINKENGRILDTRDLVTINNDKISNEELVIKELKAKKVMIPDEYKNIQSSLINNQTVLTSMEDKSPTSRYKSKDISQEISNISNTGILPENQKLIIENSIEPVLKNFKNEMVEKITQLYLNKDSTSSDNTTIFENHNINLTNNLQTNQQHNNADNKKNKNKLIETLRSQLKNNFHKNDISRMILDKKKIDNNQLYKYLENIIKTNMNPNEMHLQRLDENNFKTLVSIAKNQLNKQQLDNEFKMMTLENVTPNFEIKKTNDDEKVQDTEIKLKNIPNDTSIKIETTTESIKSNTSEETEVKSNIDNKNKGELIKLKNKVNDLRKIQNMFKINEIPENNNRDTTIKSKPTENASIEQIKKQEDKVVKITMFNDAEDLTIEKENIYKFPQLIINENVIEKPNSEVSVPIKNTNISKNTAKEIKELKIASESPTYNDSKKFNEHKINREKIENTDKTLENNKSELIISHSQLANDSTPAIIIQLKREKDDSYKVLNTKFKLTTLQSTINKINCNKIKNKNITPNNSSSAGIVTVNKENETSTIIDISRVTEIKLDKVIDRAESDTSTLINPSIKPQVQKIVVEIITNNNKTIIDSVTIIINEETAENKEVAKKNHPKTNYWIQINDHEVYTKNAYQDTIEPIIKDKVIETEIPKTSIQTDITIDYNLKESKKKEIEESIKNDLVIETLTIPVQKSEKVENINETKKMPFTDSSTEHIEESIDDEIFYNQATEIETDKSIDNIIKEGEAITLINIPTTSDEKNIIIEETTEKPLPNEKPIKSVEESKLLDINTESVSIQNIDSSIANVEEPIDKENNPETEIETDISIHKIIKEGEASSLINTPILSDRENIIMEEKTEKPLPNESPIKPVEKLKVVDINTETEPSPINDSSIVNMEEPINKDNVPETEIETGKSIDNNIKEGESISLINVPTVSDEENIIMEETTEKQLTNEKLIKSVEEENVVDINTESELIPNNDSTIENVEDPIDKGIITETDTRTDISKDNINIECEPCSPTDTPTVSDEENIIMEELTEKPLPNEKLIKSVEEAKEVDINTESESIPHNDSSLANAEELIDEDTITETETRTDISKDNINIECEPCSPTDTPTVSDEENIIMEELTEKPLPNEKLIKYIDDIKVIDINTESKSIPNNDSTIETVEDPINKDNVPATEIETGKSIDNNIKEGESISLINVPTVSDEENIIMEETTEKQLTNEKLIKSVEEENVVDINTESELIPNNDSTIENVKDPIDKGIITETDTRTDISKDNINIECEPCSPTYTQTVSGEENIIMEETTEKQLTNEKLIKSVEEENVVDINTESELIPNNDSTIENVKDPIDKGIITETDTRTDISKDNINIECEPCSPTYTQTVSGEENIIMEETTEKQLTNEKLIKSVEEENVVDINTESELIPNNDSTIENVKDPIDKGIITETDTRTDISKDNINIECEPCSPTDTPTVSDEEKLIMEETTEMPLPNETLIKSVEEAKVVDINTESESIPHNDSSLANAEELIDKDTITETETRTDISKDNINIESEPCSPTDTPTVSDEENIIMEVTTEKPLPNETSIKPVEELKVVDINTETESSPTIDSTMNNIEEPIDKENNPDIKIETHKSIDNIIKEGEASSLITIPYVTDEENIIMEETTEMPLPNETSIKPVEELKVVDINTESESIPHNDSSLANAEELIDEDTITETETRTDISKDNINIECEPCSPTDTPTVSDEENIIMEELTEKPLPNEKLIKYIDDIKVIDINTESKLIPHNDSSLANAEDPFDKGIITETETRTDISKDNINIECEPCSPTDTPTVSDEENIIMEETTEKPLPNETPIKPVEKLKVVAIKTETEPSTNNDSSIAYVEKPINKDNVPETDIETSKSIDNNIKEDEAISTINVPTVSDEKNIVIEETTEISLPNETQIKSVDKVKVVDIKTKMESVPNNDFSITNEEGTIGKENNPETEIETDISIHEIIKEGEVSSLINTPTVSDEENIIMEESTEMPLPNEALFKSVEEANVVDINTESELITNNDSTIENVEDPIDKGNITETDTRTDISKDNINIECEPCSPTDTPTVSDEKNIIMEVTTEKPLPNETSFKPVEELKVVDINTETEPSPINDSSIVNMEEPINKDNVPETEIETGKSIDNNIKEGESISLINVPTVSGEENIIMEETTEKQLTNEKLIKSVEEENVVDINTESELIPNNDSTIENVKDPIDKGIITETDTRTDISKDNINIECEPCSPTDTPTVSDEENIIMEELTEKPLPNEKLIKSVEEAKEVDINTESESIPHNDSSLANAEELIDEDTITETETRTDISKDNINIECEPCSPTDTPTVSDEENIIMEVTTEKPLPNETSIKPVEELKVVDINTETESSPTIDSTMNNIEEPIDKENNPDIKIETHKSIDNIIKEGEASSLITIPYVTDEENIIMEETTETPLPNETSIKPVEELKVVDINTESESIPHNDSSLANAEELIDEDTITETETRTDISKDNINIECEPCSPTDTPTVSDEENIIMEELTEKPLPNEKLIKYIDDIKVIDINTESKLIPHNDSSLANAEDPFDKGIITETETRTDISKDNINIECEPCSPTDTPTVSDEENIIMEETTEKPLPNETPIKPVEKLKVVAIKTETEPSTNNDSSIAYVEKPINKDNVPETDIETSKSIDNNIKEDEAISTINVPTVSDEKNIVIEETTEISLPNETQIKSVDKVKVVDIKTKMESVPNNDFSITNEEGTIGKENNPDIKIETHKSIDNIIKEGEASSLITIPYVTDEENIIMEETTEMPLPNETSIKPVEELKVVDINTESESIPHNDSSLANAEELIDEDTITETETRTDISKDNINIECEPCSPTDTPTVSDEENIIMEELTEKPLPNEKLIKYIDDIKVIDINTESKLIPHNDSSLANAEDPFDKGIITETETRTDISKDNINIECEPCSPTDTPTVSDEENIIMEETTEKPLPNETPIKPVEKLKVVAIKTETEPSTNNDSSIAYVEKPINKDNVPETDIETSKSIDNNIKEDEAISTINVPTVSDEKNIVIEETTEISLPNETQIKSVDKVKVVDIKTKMESVPNNDFSITNEEGTIGKENNPDIKIETHKSIDNIIKEGEASSLITIPYVTDEENIIMEETTEMPLPNETSIKPVEELKVVDINTESESIPHNDSSLANAEELIDEDTITETETRTDISKDNINIECEPCSPTDTPTVSDEENIIMEELTEKPLPNEKLIKYIDDIKVIDINTESKLIPHNDSSLANAEDPFDKGIITETETRTDISKDNINIECEPCSPTDTPTVSDEENIIMEETTEKPLPNETPIKPVEKLKVVAIKTETEPSTNNDSSIAYVEKPINKDNVPETDIETSKSIDNNIKEDEAISTINVPTVSDEKNIVIEETTEISLPNETQIKSVDKVKVVDIKTKMESVPNNDFSITNEEGTIGKENNPETEIETDISIHEIIKEGEVSSLINTPTVSDEENIIMEESTEMPLPNEALFKSVEEANVVDINTESELITNNDSTIENVEDPIDKGNITETDTRTDISKDNINIECEPCSPTDTPTVSDEKNIIMEVTTEKPLPNETSFKPVEELKVVDINTETEPSPINDSSIVNMEEPINKDNVPETEIETGKSIDNNIKEGESISLINVPTVSDEKNIIIEEKTEIPSPYETLIKSVEELKAVDINTESNSMPNNDPTIENVEDPIVKSIITETETRTDISKDNINIESEPCSPTDTPTVCDEENIIMEETTEMSLPNEALFKSVEEANVVDINTESESIPNNDPTIENVEDPIDKGIITETEKYSGKFNITCEPCTSTTSDEEKIIIEVTAQNPLPIKTPFKYVKELKIIDSKTEIESSPNTDSSTINVERPINKDNVPVTQIETEISINNIIKEVETSTLINIPTVSDKENIIIVETTVKPLPNETPIKPVKKLKVVAIKTETEPSPINDSSIVNMEEPINKDNVPETEIETCKSIDNNIKECKSCFPTDKLAASDKENNLTEETIEILLPIETSIKPSIKSIEESKVKKVNTETVFVPSIDSLTVNAEEPLDEDYFSKIVIKTDKTLDFIVKECETCPPVDTSMYVTEEIKGIDDTIEKLIPIGPSFVVVETENLKSIDGFNRIVNRKSGRECFKDIESSTRLDTAAFVKDQKLEENGTLIENILTTNTSTASVQAQIQVEEVIKDESMLLINDSVTFDEMSPEEQKKIETAKISSITVMEKQTDINRDDVMYTCEESLDKTIEEKDIDSETTSTIDILVTVVEEQRALEIEVSKNATRVLDDTSTETVENLIKTKKNTEKETTTPIVVVKSEVERNELKVMSENKTSTPVHLASTNTEQTETDMVTEIASPNVKILNSNTKKILIDKEMITENPDNPKNRCLEFGETSNIHSLENEDNLQGKSYGIQKLEMSVQRMKTSNEDYYEKTFLQLEQTEKISVENKDKVDCENKNIIDDKLYTVNESDLNAILCASSLEEALTLLDSKIKFKFKHRKLSNKAYSTPHIPKTQISESRSSGTNTNFTDAREFFKEIEKKCKK